MTRLSALAVIALLALPACSSPPANRNAAIPLPLAPSVDINKYLGRWYEIARLPNGFEKNCEGVTADYSLRADGKIKVVNTCREGAAAGELKIAQGRARIVDASTNAKLKVSFFGPFWGDYWILWLAEDYSLSLVGEPSGRYLWILSRTPTISDDVKAAALNRLQQFGYDTAALYFPAQPPSPDDASR
ncbi:MAG: lipocalin family protein [Amphiplicatus sp.]